VFVIAERILVASKIYTKSSGVNHVCIYLLNINCIYSSDRCNRLYLHFVCHKSTFLFHVTETSSVARHYNHLCIPLCFWRYRKVRNWNSRSATRTN